MEIDRTFVIFDCKPNGSDLFFGGAIVLSQTLGDSLAFGNIDFERNYKAIHSMLNNRMWMVHDKVNCARLTYGCNKIGKPPPTPTSVIDTSLFTSSKTKLGRASVMFGLGNGPNGYESNLSAILACTEIMSKLDVPMETLNDTVHPMIYYLMQYNDQMNDEVRARYFNEAEYPSLNKIDDIPIMMLVDDVLTTRKAEFKKLYSERQKQKEDDDDDVDDDVVDDEDDDDAVVKPKELYSERQKQKEDDDDDDDNHFVVGGKAVVKPKELYIAGLKQLKTGSLLRPVYHDYNNILSRNDDDDDDDDDDVDDDVVDDDDDDDFVVGGKAVVKPKELYSERQKQKDDDDDDDDDNHNHFVVGGKAVVKPKELYIAGLKYLKTGSMLRPVYHDYNNILSRKDDDDDEDSDNDQDQDMMNDDD